MRTRLVVAVALMIACALPAPRTASAGGEMLKHGVESLIAAPLEFLVSPYVAGDTLNSNLTTQHYSIGGKIAFAVPGFTWLLMAQVCMASGRAVAGIVEVPYGLALLVTPFDPDPLLDLENEPALVEHPTEPFRFGIYFARRD